MRGAKYKILLVLTTAGFIVAGNLFSPKVSAIISGTNTLVSDNGSNDGSGGNNDSGWSNFNTGAMVSKSGNYVAFNSNATNLVSNDTNAKQDVFVRNLGTNTTTRVSVSSSGVQADDSSEVTAISQTGRYILFNSNATNLVDGQTYSNKEVYIHDMQTGTTSIASVNGSGNLMGVSWSLLGTGVSNDGRFITIESEGDVTSDTTNPNYYHVYLVDRTLGTWTLLDKPISGSQQNTNSEGSQMSCDGAFIVFQSGATNLTSDSSNGHSNIFLVDTRTGNQITELESSANGSNTKPAISCNGNYVDLDSAATNLVSGVSSAPYGHYYEYNRLSGETVLLDQSSAGTLSNSDASGPTPQIDDNGNTVFTSAATNLTSVNNRGQGQIYLRNVNNNTTETLSVDSSGIASSMAAFHAFISADGKQVSFIAQHTSNLVSTSASAHDNVIVARTDL